MLDRHTWKVASYLNLVILKPDTNNLRRPYPAIGREKGYCMYFCTNECRRKQQLKVGTGGSDRRKGNRI